jgi:hypothetical protein
VGECIYGFHYRSPQDTGEDCIFVVVDRLTKFAHFFAISMGVVACLWLGDNSDIVYGKTSTSNILTGYGPTLPSEQSNRWKVDREFLVKLVVAPVVVATRVFDFAAAANPNLNSWALSVKHWT